MSETPITRGRNGARILMAFALVFVASFSLSCTSRTDSDPNTAASGTRTGAGTTTAPADTGTRPAGLTTTGTMTPLTGELGEVNAYMASPSAPGTYPAVVVVHEWWGLNSQIKTVADRIAAMGYHAIVPDLYHGVVAEDAEKAHELTRGLEDSRALSDIAAAANHARTAAAGAPAGGSPVGIIGFCMGGRLALLASMSEMPLQAAVMFYGPPVTDPAELAGVKAPILALFGREDEGIPLTTVQTFEDNLKAAGKSVEVVIYDGAGHAFMNDTRPSHRPEAATDAWERVEAFFARHLKS
jgi:carboxymethylenebutenolidase